MATARKASKALKSLAQDVQRLVDQNGNNSIECIRDELAALVESVNREQLGINTDGGDLVIAEQKLADTILGRRRVIRLKTDIAAPLSNNLILEVAKVTRDDFGIVLRTCLSGLGGGSNLWWERVFPPPHPRPSNVSIHGIVEPV